MGYNGIELAGVCFGTVAVALAGVGIKSSLDENNKLLTESNRIAQVKTIVDAAGRDTTRNFRGFYFEDKIGDSEEDLILRYADGKEDVWMAISSEKGTTYRSFNR